MKWSEVKKEVSKLEKRELVNLVGELYKVDTKINDFSMPVSLLPSKC